MRIFKNAWFAKFARKERIGDAALCEAIVRAGKGLIDADLGSGLIKQRISRQGSRKSGGYRTLILFRQAERAIFVGGFAKNERENLSALELEELRKAAKYYLMFSQQQMDKLVHNETMIEVSYAGEDIQD